MPEQTYRDTTPASQDNIGITDAELSELSGDELRAYFAPCVDALDFDPGKPRRVANRFPANHLVYFIQGAGGAIKIGFTQQDLKERLKCLQTGSPVALEVLAAVNAPKQREGYYHRRFAEHRLYGEWFAPHPDILAEIDRLQAKE